MRSPLHPTQPAHRGRSRGGKFGSDSPTAEAILGTRHPLVAALRQGDTVREQAVSVTAVQAAGLVWLSGGLGFGLWLAVAGLVVQVGLGGRHMALMARRRELCLKLIVEGHRPLPLACLDQERRRLLDPRTVERLAEAFEDIVASAARRPAPHPASRPLFQVLVIRQVAPELREIASLLRSQRGDVQGVAAAEWLLTSPASPLYGAELEPLRQEIWRLRYLLAQMR
jgi:hypothetical protein